MKQTYNECPQCGYRLSWLQRWKLSSLFARKIIACPSCNTPLKWNKWHRVLHVWLWLEVVLILLVARFNDHSYIWFALALIGAAGVLIALCFLHLEGHSRRKNSN
jgi:CXXC-20-CXXC protein